MLVLLSEGSQILALTLDISVKLKYLSDTISFACESPRPDFNLAIGLLNSTIADMDIDYSHAVEEHTHIQSILHALRDNPPLCPDGDGRGSLTLERSHDLMGNVTVSLFSSMGITPADNALESGKVLMTYLQLLGFVYIYYFVVAALAMFILAAFVYLTQRHTGRLYVWSGVGIRVLLGAMLLGMTFIVFDFERTYKFMTSAVIIFTFTLALFVALLVDRLLDSIALKPSTPRDGAEIEASPVMMSRLSPVPTDTSNHNDIH
ncbi:hypothetical protein FQN50_003146 [Emmonsiellopsis sp. PD_5]|nr:hypothetical protein FQN50_003146 [Emmonsiellopsis sp. PD_5]